MLMNKSLDLIITIGSYLTKQHAQLLFTKKPPTTFDLVDTEIEHKYREDNITNIFLEYSLAKIIWTHKMVNILNSFF